MATLLLLGDLAPVELRSIYIEPDPQASEALVLANLETPLCSPSLPTRPKSGPHLRADPESLAPLATAFPHLAVNLANNHIYDYDAAGLAATHAACAQHGVTTFGAGENLVSATAPCFVMHDGLRIGLIGACERQFGHAESSRAGTAPFTSGIYARVSALRSASQRVIVSVHGAAEMSPWPAPQWQEALRALVDAGADVVHGHHSHVPQGFERYGSGWIFYGAGNTIVNPAYWHEDVQTRHSLRFALNLQDLSLPPEVSAWEVSPRGAADTIVVRRTRLDEARLLDCNVPLADSSLLEALWQETAMDLWSNVHGPVMRLGNSSRERIEPALRSLRDISLALGAPNNWAARLQDRRRFYYHLFACDHHAQAIATALALQTGEITDRRTAESRRLARAWLPRDRR